MTPDSIAALIARCQKTVAKIKDPTVRHEYELFLKRQVRQHRIPDSQPVSECLRAPTEQELFWIELNIPSFGRLAGCCTLEIGDDVFVVVPMLHTAAGMLDAEEPMAQQHALPPPRHAQAAE